MSYDSREELIWYAEQFIGTWYKWGGSDPSGFDCSGFACECLQSVGIIGRKDDFSAAGLYKHFATSDIKMAKRGALVFYRAVIGGPIIHVEICRNEFQCIGASGGGSKTLTIEDAIRDKAFIKVRTILSRPFIAGYVDPCL